MTSSQANKQAAKSSKTEGAKFVVWVFDEGRSIFNAEQARIYGPLVQIEAAFVAGVQVSVEVAA